MEKFKTQKIFLPSSPIGMQEDLSLVKMNIIIEGDKNVELNYVDRIVLTKEELRDFARLAFAEGVSARLRNIGQSTIASVNVDRDQFLKEQGLVETSILPNVIPERDNHHE